ncbi:EAL domain-containing protein [Colwellia sp. D2M02]|uniref:EAL domain-containing response regulator n=1 Tax=Colwellia sp. D2M02 TaxID=2841562 RepID=UPI001C09D526|nr:EAL domain-containing response regulator [Colwellia sp. D2M02]MBU2893778.1 EAL domain-containing protein [Colwellia sp. D2M02]
MKATTERPSFDWLNVLLVDDSQAILSYVSKVLENNFNIRHQHVATSAPEAMQILRQSTQINLLFLDLNMPNIDGIQLLEKLSKLEYKGYVVIMSGISTKIISSVGLLAKKYGLNYLGTLVKPIHEDDFENIFNKIGTSRVKRPTLESLKNYEIIRAIKSDNIEVRYQPQVELSSRGFIGVEALCRMNHPSLGMVSPDRFIDKAEESELIIHITLAVLKKSMRDWKHWFAYGLDLKLSVNISPIALQQPEFADTIFSLLTEFSMPADRLCLEITEGVLANDQAQELVNLNRLKMRGVALALDDFGQRHSTIERLQELPLTYLKLDKSYFIDNQDNPNQISLINTSLSIAKKLNMRTIAEGIEDSRVMSLVTEMGCDIAQGYFIAKPMEAKHILAWQRDWLSLT